MAAGRKNENEDLGGGELSRKKRTKLHPNRGNSSRHHIFVHPGKTLKGVGGGSDRNIYPCVYLNQSIIIILEIDQKNETCIVARVIKRILHRQSIYVCMYKYKN